MSDVNVYVFHMATGEPRWGIWCDEHALPHVLEVDLYDLREDGPHPFGTYRSCDDETPPPDPKV